MNPAEYERMFRAEETQWWYVGMRAVVLALLEPLLDTLRAEGRRLAILDAGCGTGRNLHQLGAFGRAVGIDLSKDALAFCRGRGVASARASLLALPFPDESFDCVASLDVLYHGWVGDDRAAGQEMARVLRPGGLLLVRVPALKMLWGAHDRAVHSRHRYTRPELVGLLEACGLRVERASYSNFVLFMPLLLRRTLDRILGREGSDVAFLPAPLEWAFRRALLLEAALLRRGVSFPIGASVVAVARRPAPEPKDQRRATSA
jgi:SAM-dependent methyltransferase